MSKGNEGEEESEEGNRRGCVSPHLAHMVPDCVDSCLKVPDGEDTLLL